MNPTDERRTNGDRRKIRKVRKAIFPAAGLGTRFLPATKAQPKEMLPLVDKPIIQYGVEEAVAAGCDQIIIITGRGKSAIEDHFDVSYELEKMLEEKGKHDLLNHATHERAPHAQSRRQPARAVREDRTRRPHWPARRGLGVRGMAARAGQSRLSHRDP